MVAAAFKPASSGAGGRTTYAIHTDHLGGTNVVTDQGGEVTEVTDYYPYGGLRIDDQAGSFTGVPVVLEQLWKSFDNCSTATGTPPALPVAPVNRGQGTGGVGYRAIWGEPTRRIEEILLSFRRWSLTCR